MRRDRDKTEKVLRPVRPNAGIEAAYRAALRKLVRRMADDYERVLARAYRRNEPEMAQDATPAIQLRIATKKLGDRWRKNLNAAAPKLAMWFAEAVDDRSQAALRYILKKGGLTVKFKMTPAMRDILAATLSENVSLIKSIGTEYHTQIEGAVMRSVAAGRDLGPLTTELRARYGVSFRRAALIARDQNNKATAMMTRARQQEIGITEAIWLHSHGGKVPRKTHLANDGKRYDTAKGWFDPDPKVKRWIWPGELINCRCVSKPIVKGLT